MRLVRSFSSVLLTLAALACSSPVSAQLPPTTGIEADLPALRREAAPLLPSLVLRGVAEVALPGPLAGAGPRLDGERIAVRLASGLALVAPLAGAAPELQPDPGPRELDSWVEGPDGRLRFRSVPGWIVAQKRCARCSAGWKRAWKLRVGGNTLVPPLALKGRVCFGTLEDRVYCVNDRNGHRLWLAELPGRIAEGLVLWSGSVEAEQPAETPTAPLSLEVLLVAADGGSQLVALAATTGQKLAGLQVSGAGERLVGAPAVTGDGRIVVARQGYQPTEAALAIYRLYVAPSVPPPPPSGAGPAVSPVAAPAG